MAGITLTTDEIRAAPPEVRRWLEREVANALGQDAGPSAHESGAADHLVACQVEEAAAVFELIRGMLPVANLFFELGREGQPTGREGIEAHPLPDMMRHTRLDNIEQFATCLQVIDDAVRRVRGDAHATCCLLDRRGYCLVASTTSQSIRRVWSEMIAMPPARSKAQDNTAEAGTRRGQDPGGFGALPGGASPLFSPSAPGLPAAGPAATADGE